MSRRVLVTGASGFIGRPLVQALAADGWTVIGASRKRPDRELGAAEWVETDLLTEDPQALAAAARAEVLVNLAWIATPGVYAESLQNLDWLRAATALSAAFLAAGGRQIIAAGTCLEYDCGEGRATGPRSLYGAAKHAYRLALRRQAAETGAAIAWARVFHLLGPEDHPNRFVTSLARRLVNGEPAEISQGLVVRDFIDIRDCASCMTALASTNASGDFDIATGRPMRICDVAFAMAKASGRPDLLRINPALDRAGEMQELVGDPRLLKEATGARAIYSIEESLAHVLEHFQSQKVEST